MTDFTKNFVLKLNDKLQPIILTGQTILVKQNPVLSLWLISLLLGIFGCLILGFIPFYNNPEISLIQAPFFKGLYAKTEVQPKQHAVNERKMFLRHAFHKRLNVSSP